MPSTSNSPHVAERLRREIALAESKGFEVRKVLLETPTADWCQVGTKRIIFLDLAAGAAEQLRQLAEILLAYDRVQSSKGLISQEGRAKSA